MKSIAVTGFAILALVTGLIAAWYWWQSTRVPVKNANPNPRSWDATTLGLAAGTVTAYKEVSKLNKWAAIFTAISVVSSAISALVGASCSC
jgi:hypothetical protein